MFIRCRLVLLVLTLLGLGQAQVVVPTFGSRGEVTEAVVEQLVAAFRTELAQQSGLAILPGEVVTRGIAGSLDVELAIFFTELERGRYGVSGEVSPTPDGQRFSVTILAVDAQTRRASDLITQSFDEANLPAVARVLAEAVTEFISPVPRLVGGTASWFISSQPEGAAVFVNGLLMGRTGRLEPLLLQPGRYQLELRKDGYLLWTSTVTLEADRSEFTTALLTPISGGTIQVVSAPTAAVTVEGREVGLSPITVPALPGMRTVRLSRPGFETKTVSVTVRNFRVSRVDETLRPLFDTMLFWELPPDQMVRLDGVRQASPFAGPLRPGRYLIERWAGLEPTRFEVVIPEEGGVFRVDFEQQTLVPFAP
jgi:AcrR family transcriptional regulator